jgi:carbon storage regulator
MLVLSRKVGERIVVPGVAVTLTVVAIEGNTIRLGISAPADVPVLRKELWYRMPLPPPGSPAQE